jgi:predicted ATPase/DNA-binding SARP family transcriptional activator
MPAHSSPDALDIRVLGPLGLSVDGVEVPVPPGTQRALLAMLVLGRGRAVSRSRLADGLWGEEQPKDPRAALHTAVARLRRTLGPQGAAVRTLSFGYLLEVAPASLDADRFSGLHARARALLAEERGGSDEPPDPERAVGLLEESLALWRGPAWAEFADGIASGEALRLEEERLVVLEDLARAHLTLGSVDRAVAVAEELAAGHPLRDRTIALLVEALHRYGRSADALEVVERYRARRADELGLDPAPVVAAAQLRVLRQEPAPAPTAPPAPGAPDPVALTGSPGPGLVGRREEVAEVAGLLRTAALVTLVGPGGVGKTALARHVTSTRPDGTTWVDLAVVRDRPSLLDALADALGVEAGSREGLEALVLDRLAAEPGLVVLDNCEHLLDDLVPILTARGQPSYRVLATSRERLGIPGEHVLRLGPLPVGGDGEGPDESPAVELFLRRAAEAGARLEQDARTLRQVARLCRALDGLPLALELAAGRVGGLTVDDLLDRLDRRFEVLTSGPRSAPRRQRTLRSVFDWSFDLLEPEERTAFGRLAVFPSSFGLSAAEVVLADDGLPAEHVPDVLGRLVARSVLPPPRGSAGGRYRMLETVRQYALSRLPATDLAETRRRHALWTIDAAGRARAGLEGSDEARWHEVMTGLVDDLRAAWRWADDARDVETAGLLVQATWRWAYWRLRADFLEWGARLLEDLDDSAPVLAYPAAAAAAWLGADPQRAADIAALALRRHPDDADLADVHEVLGDVRMTQADVRGALEAYTTAERLHRARGDEWSATIALAEQLLPVAYGALPWRERVEGTLREARRSANPTALAFARYAEAEACAPEDETRARAALDEALELAEAAGNRLVTGIALTASVALESRAAVLEPRTWKSFEAAIRHWTTSRSSTLLLPTLRNLVVLLGRSGRHADAVELWAAVEQVQGGHHSYGAEADRVEQALTTARRALGTEFEAAARRGRTCLTLDDAARLGSRMTRPTSGPSDAPDRRVHRVEE